MSHFIRAFAAMALAASLAGCPEDEVVVPNLFIEVTSDAPTGGKLESLRILFQKGDAHYPASPADPTFNPSLGDRDPAAGPVLFSIAYDGSTFGDGKDVVVSVTGRIGDAPVTRFEGSVDLAVATIVKVHLVGLPGGCDPDGDGFLDCGIDGCCAPGSVFGDCGGADASPWLTEAECEPCEDVVDQDCKDGDVPCVDGDGDDLADCGETCGRGDPLSGPGKLEICDGKDNDCDAATDEGLTLTFGGQVLDLGDECGLGACAGGVVECGGNGAIRCSSDNKRAAVEDCETGADDNCNGVTDEGCSAADFDGDGSLAPADCNDFDAGIYPGRPGEPCCAQGTPEAACDVNCDGDVSPCEVGDQDRDGVTVGEGDCDDNDAGAAPGKPEKCGDGVDQDCAGGDLACDGQIDSDSDGWPSAADCNDDDDAIGPDQGETCNGKDDDCDFMVDEGNPGGGGSCGESDVGDCALGTESCQNSGGVVGRVTCVGSIAPQDGDLCDGHDEDCDGDTDEDFTYVGLAIGEACDGIGGCGAGTVECAAGRSDLATCSTDPDGSEPGDFTEVCDTVDNDCDGQLNEGLDDVTQSTCFGLGVCATGRDDIVATCTAGGVWDCDYGNVAGYEAGAEVSCDELDNDCDGEVNEDLGFTEPGGAVRPFGAGCDGADADSCDNGVVGCSAGGGTVCTEAGGVQEELCDGADNDCDGETDEDFQDTPTNRVRLGDALLADDNGAFLGDVCGAGACAGGTVVCGTTLTLKCSTDPRTPASPSAPTDTCDGNDNDCDGVFDESFIAGGTVKVTGALFSGDNGKVKGASCGAGACSGGTVVCASATTLACSTDANGQTTNAAGQTVAKTDTCNGVDDNCNNVVDDDFVATSGPNRKPLAGALLASDNGKIKGASCGAGECVKEGATTLMGSVVCAADGTKLLCSSDSKAATDTCDGLDNDCDGTSDDPFVSGGTTTLQNAKFTNDNGKFKGATCGTGSCANGKVVCTASKAALVCDSDSKSASDVCDNVDNDCNGVKDDTFKYQNLSIGQSCNGIGACGSGTVVCAVGVTNLATCSTNPNGPGSQAATEVCDGVDNDCDDQLDEGFALGASCPAVGACGAGVIECKGSDPTTTTCSTQPGGSADQSSPEVCDSADNDCDGNLNEGFTYEGAAVGAGCNGIGECGAGTVECAGTAAVTCSTNPDGSARQDDPEVCDTFDNDCDGSIDGNDSNLVRDFCGIQLGVCNGSKKPAALCVGGNWGDCVDASYEAHNAAFGPETCDTLDNDCDDQTDAADGTLVRDDCAKQSGVCSGSKKPVALCVGGNWGDCVDATYEAHNAAYGEEICDGLDNNCDAELDKADGDLVIPDCELTVGECQGAKKPLSLCTETLTGWNACGAAEYNANSALKHSGVSKYGSELCDTWDNDCDSTVDAADSDLVRENCQNQNGECAGAKKPVSFCQSGAWTGTCGDTEYEAHNPSGYGPEVCDTDDNDCDNQVDAADDQLVRPNCELTLGVCNGTSKPSALCGATTAGVWDACTQATYEAQRPGGLPSFPDPYMTSDALCDNADNDCNGESDEEVSALSGAHDPDDDGSEKGDPCGTGVCDPGGVGVVQCRADETALECSTDGSANYNAVENCDNDDDDCDGLGNNDDEDLEAGPLCLDQDGECNGATATDARCPTSATDWEACLDADYLAHKPLTFGAEECDSWDNDCDSQTDAADSSLVLDQSCDNQVGLCAGSKKLAAHCEFGTWDEGGCDPADYEAHNAAYDETDLCNGVDNDCSGIADDDAPDDDGDGVFSCTDCDDTAGNWSDLDEDNICILGGRAICANGTATACDDNCPEASNTSQADGNNDGVGDACDICQGTPKPEPHEVCGNCLNDDCSGGTADDPSSASCIYRRILVVKGAAAIPIDYSVSLTFDHAALVVAARSTASGDDLRLYYRNADGTFTQIDRVLEPSSAWNTATTKIWFKSQAAIGAGVENRDYYLYSNVTGGTIMATAANVFHFVDFFDGADATNVPGWTDDEESTTGAEILVKSLTFTSTTNNLRRGPGVRAPVTAVTTGRYIARIGWNWTFSGGDDSQWTVAAQFGTFADTDIRANNDSGADPLLTTNVATTLALGRGVWNLESGSNNNVEFGLVATSSDFIATAFTGVADNAITGVQSAVDLLLDLDTDKALIDTDGDGAAAFAGNDPAGAAGSGFSFSNNVGISRVRLYANQVNSPAGDHPSRKLDYIYLRKAPASGQSEPVVSYGGREPLAAVCTPVNTGLVARYHLDDPRNDALGSSTTTVRDSATTPLNLFRNQVLAQPVFVSFATLWGLAFITDGGAGFASADAASSTKFTTQLSTLPTATVELVTTLAKLTTADHFLIDIHDDVDPGAGEHRLSLSANRNSGNDANVDIKAWVNGALLATWTEAIGNGWPRTVLHLVVNFDATDGEELKLYRNGRLLSNVASLVTLINLTADPVVMVGNGLADNASPIADVYYAAFYGSALDAATVKAQALKLLANDDRR